MKRSLAWGAALALVALPLQARAGDTRVEVSHNRLEPAEITISTGDSVTFHNLDEMPGGHSVVADDGSFESPPLAKDETWTHKFEKSGSHPYKIKEHPGATGTITVK